MTEALQIVLLVAVLAFLLVLFRKVGRFEEAAIVVTSRLDALERAQVRIERTIREEVATTRGELTNEAREQRQELNDILMTFAEAIAQRLTDVARMQNGHLDGFSDQLASFAQGSGEGLDGLSELATSQKAELEKMSSAIARLVESNEKKLEAIRVTVENRLQSTQAENTKQLDTANSGRKTTRHARKASGPNQGVSISDELKTDELKKQDQGTQT
jgi:DNA recombination protein RmuC